MRAMKQHDLAFFYHSNCKKPGIVGVMEIVKEHSVDGRTYETLELCHSRVMAKSLSESAFDPDHPYYDPKSCRDNPRWFLVHVEFRRKFETPIELTELREYAKKGGPLENMQAMSLGRLSVSKVSKAEWSFLMDVVNERQERLKNETA
jgi:predicted RNA-binding protein with PUA-like domain